MKEMIIYFKKKSADLADYLIFVYFSNYSTFSKKSFPSHFPEFLR